MTIGQPQIIERVGIGIWDREAAATKSVRKPMTFSLRSLLQQSGFVGRSDCVERFARPSQRKTRNRWMESPL